MNGPMKVHEGRPFNDPERIFWYTLPTTYPSDRKAVYREYRRLRKFGMIPIVARHTIIRLAIVFSP